MTEAIWSSGIGEGIGMGIALPAKGKRPARLTNPPTIGALRPCFLPCGSTRRCRRFRRTVIKRVKTPWLGHAPAVVH